VKAVLPWRPLSTLAVSTLDQHVENQLHELRTYCERRCWTATEFIDQGVSGAKERRPALDEM
jgi:DNA invertase Pin-like site-specific DNA recombinase